MLNKQQNIKRKENGVEINEFLWEKETDENNEKQIVYI